MCRLFFKATLKISNSDTDAVLKKKKDFLYNKINDGLLRLIIGDINKSPRKKSEYAKAATNKEYLKGPLNVSIIYNLYTKQSSKHGIPMLKNIITGKFLTLNLSWILWTKNIYIAYVKYLII